MNRPNIARRTRIGSVAIKATFPGHCELCERPFPTGALVVMTRQGWAHASCPDGWE